MIFGPIIQWLLDLVKVYGLPGLFIESFIVSTIFVPFNVEVTFPILLGAGFHVIPILLVATIGSLLGTLLNYYLGYKGVNLAHKYVKPKELAKATHLMNKYGWAGLLAMIVIPFFPVDPLTVLCGAAKMNIKEFIAVIFFGKLIKYAVLLNLSEIMLKILGA